MAQFGRPVVGVDDSDLKLAMATLRLTVPHMSSGQIEDLTDHLEEVLSTRRDNASGETQRRASNIR